MDAVSLVHGLCSVIQQDKGVDMLGCQWNGDAGGAKLAGMEEKER